MTEPTDPKNGDEQPSRHDHDKAGWFSPTPDKQIKKIAVDGVLHPGTRIEKDKERNEFIVALSTKILVGYGVEKGKIESLFKNTSFKTLSLEEQISQRQKIEKDLITFYQEIQDALTDKTTSVDYISLFTVFEKKLTNLVVHSNELERLLLENTTKKIEEFKSFIPYIEQLKELEERISGEALENKDIFAVYNSLSWLSGAFDPLTFKKEMSVDEAEISLEKLKALISGFEVVTASEASAGNEIPDQQEDTVEKYTNQAIQEAEEYIATAQGLKAAKEITKKIQNLKNKFAKKNKNEEDIELINNLTQKLTKAVEEAKQGPKPQRDEFADIYGSEESKKLIGQIKMPTPPLSNNSRTPPESVTPPQQIPATNTPVIPLVPQTQAVQTKTLRPTPPSRVQPAPSTQINPQIQPQNQVIPTVPQNTSQTLDSSNTPIQQTAPGTPNEPNTPNQEESRGVSGNINLPEIKLNRNTTDVNGEDKYKIKIDDKWEIVPRIHLGTLNRYKTVFDNENYSDKDFSRASTHKDAVLEALRVGNFDEADKQARALGKELNSIEGIVTAPVKNNVAQEEPSSENEPENYKKRAFWNTRVSTISLDGAGEWRIKKGNVYVKMNEQELAQWLPINNKLTEYSSFINSPDEAYNYSFLVKLKNELLDALEESNLNYAEELAKKLAREFDPILEQEIVPVKEKTAARIRYEIRQYNLKHLKDNNIIVPRDDTVTFAFISDPQSNVSREYRIIDEKTGDWVPLKKNLTTVELAQNVLTNFKNRTSSTPERIQKKNEVLFFINNYDFENAKKAAQEYMAAFSGITKQNPLRPTISGSQPSPAIEKANKNKALTAEVERLVAIEEELEISLPFLSSDLEKAAFTRLLTEQKALLQSISDNPTRESLALFTAKNDRIMVELEKKKKFLNKQFGDITKSIPLEINNDAKIIRSARLRGTNDVIETLGERSARLSREEGSTDITQTRVLNNKAELLGIHKDMQERNPDLYNEIYANKNIVRDTLTEDISTHTLANTKIPPITEMDTRKNFLKNLVEKTPQEHLKELTERKHTLAGKKQELLVNNLHGIITEGYEEKLKAIEEELLSITEEEKSYTDVILGKFNKAEVEPTTNSFLSEKQVYSPAADTFDYSQYGIGRNYEVDENGQQVKINRAELTKEQIEKTYAYSDEVNTKDPQETRRLKEEVILSDGLYPNHRGMSKIITENEARNVEGATPLITMGEGAQEISYPEVDPEQPTEQDTETPEKVKEKLAKVGKLFDSLIKKVKPTTVRQWFTLGLTTLGVTAGVGAVLGKIEKNNIEDRRIIDAIKKQPSWKNYVGEKVSEQFLKDFTGESKLNYKELIVKYAPSFGINQNNPSAGDKLSNLICKDVYFVIGANAGVNEEQQVESSMLIDNLKEIMIAAKASLGTLYSETDITSGAIFGTMTIQQYYDVVKQEVEKAEVEKARLGAIK